jgi:hypothetical protein
MSENYVWSKPYYGVTHTTVRRRQCTVTNYTHADGNFARATVFPVVGTTDTFWSDAKSETFEGENAVDLAKAWCIKEAL